MNIKVNLELVVGKLSVRGRESDGLFEAGVATFPNDTDAWWRVFL